MREPMPEANKKVLIVDDEQSIRDSLSLLLKHNFQVTTAADGLEAIDQLESGDPDLILLDVMMPKVSGFDVLDILRNTPETANVQVVMLTALSQESDKQRALDLGVDDYLVKSQVVIADVVDRVKQHLGM